VSRVVVVEELDSVQQHTVGDVPLSIGGPGSHIVLPGVPAGETAAFICADDAALYVQPAGSGVPLTVSGIPVTTSTWLHHDDLLEVGNARITMRIDGSTTRLLVSIRSSDEPTDPPQPAPAGEDLQAADPIAIVPIEYSPGPTRTGTVRSRILPRWWSWVTPIVLVVLCAGLWYLLTARSVVIQLNPQSDRMTISGGLTPRIGDRYLLRPGDYLVHAELSNHRNLSHTITVSSEPHQVIALDFEPLPGLVTISSGNLAGASIEIDGRVVGATPMEDVELAVGVHDVVVRADRHQVQSETLVITDPGQRLSLDVELIPAWAPVSITSDPSGATVMVNGIQLGTTPLVAEIGAGSHRLEVRLAGYQTAERRLRVEADVPQDFPVIQLARAVGRLTVSSVPSAATVTIDGRFAGQTPADLTLQPDIEHDIKIAKAAHEPQSTRISLSAGASEELDVTLVPLYGEVEIQSTPTGGRIMIDGESHGVTPQRIRLPAVSHSIEIRKDGFETFATTVVPEVGLLETVNAALTPVHEEPAGPPATITTSQGAVLRLIDPGTVEMGASRREPGRRANESIRRVVITTSFFMAVHEVTNAQFREFSTAHNSGHGGGTSLGGPNQPVVNVSWQDAVRYCNWLSEREGLPPVYVERNGTFVSRTPLPSGYRLPTEAEWALAARVAGESSQRKYVWGNELPIPEGAGNYGDAAARRILGGALPDYDDGFPATAPVGSFDANPLGLHDLGGNVAEWVHDPYTIYSPSTGGTEQDPTGPVQGEYHVIRGASWMDHQLTRIRLSYRDYGDEPASNLGFRIARSVQ